MSPAGEAQDSVATNAQDALPGDKSGDAPATPLVLVVACALLDADGRVLLAQRPEGKAMAGLWEFPGGKVEAGETPEDALIRELDEELGVTTKRACLAPLTFASHSYGGEEAGSGNGGKGGRPFHLLMPLFVCRRWWGTPRGREGQALAWVRPKALRERPMPPADEPLVAHLMDML